MLVPAHGLATAGLLLLRLRDEYGLRWSRSPLHEVALPLAGRSPRLTTTPARIAASRFAPLPRELAA